MALDMVELLQIFMARLVLEVFGGAGAIWGFSEAVTLRKPHTVWFWRPAALTVGFIFFIRWILQIQTYVEEKKKEDELKKPTTEGEPLIKAEYGTVA